MNGRYTPGIIEVDNGKTMARPVVPVVLSTSIFHDESMEGSSDLGNPVRKAG